MASIDLQDAYYSVPIHDKSRKYLKFMWQEQLFQFTALPNGLSSAPRLFTKIMKPVFAKLRQQGVEVVRFIDDTLVVGNTKHETEAAVTKTKELLEELGFSIHPEKSVLISTTDIKFFGFMINSRKMTVRHYRCIHTSLINTKKNHHQASCQGDWKIGCGNACHATWGYVLLKT